MSFRYMQPKGSGGHLYIPYAAQGVLSHPNLPLAIVEGEEKALKACQEGLYCGAIGGLWNWLQDGRLLADFDQIALTNWLILLYPDSDV